MSKIDYQALREAAEKATWGDWGSYKPHRGARGYEVRLSSQAIAQHVLKNNAEFIAAFNPKVALALLDERERNQQYIKRRDQENEEIALTVGKLRVELEETKSKLNEQREYYEGVIADGSKRIAELESKNSNLRTIAHEQNELAIRANLDSNNDAVEMNRLHKRIAELEAREVTLPQRLQPGADGYDDWYVHSADDGEYLKADDVIAAIRAAGIKVKGE
ncbi:ead/Ea22-like family protein [Salmonella enterica]|nr:ead/Ea22-like family protein [Salmonella enterica]EKQ0932056.1 ead/Ea22-like family protein [Salmonella enterica]EKQ0936646.1 ead/Ea22-like family protein [Salmonella enterica]